MIDLEAGRLAAVDASRPSLTRKKRHAHRSDEDSIRDIKLDTTVGGELRVQVSRPTTDFKNEAADPKSGFFATKYTPYADLRQFERK